MNANIPIAFQDIFRPARNKVFYGGRGSAKSRSFATALILSSLQGHERILCAREIQRSIQDSVKRLLDDEIRRLKLEDKFHSTKTELVCTVTDSPFMFAGLRTNIDSIKSMEGITKAWVEEAHTVSQASLDILTPTVREEGSEIWYSYNPKDKTDPVHNTFVMNTPPPDSVVKKVGFRDNPFFPDVLRAEMEWDREHNPDKYQHIWEGNPLVHSDAQVFYGAWSVEPVPEPPKGTHFYYGSDFGFSADPTTLNRMWIDDRTLYIDREAHGLRTEVDNIPELYLKVPGSKDNKIIADCARPETISYLKRQGFNIVGSKKGAGSIEDGIENMRQFKIVIDPRCKHTVDEFSLYSYKTDRLTGQVTAQIEDANNHHIDGIRYGLEPIMRNKKMSVRVL
jgi:phage terminase large subunit